ncbi:PDZ domain-containing protein [Flammeovirgaceae bacterium SG7u.111]|nr:PDZ domain-containing protein [Flammeovirgaceae bacterium SG7u.132]WPO38536.1 PDZ domain-containing protein [Flammeovirgaceae bacterium SG7u.111]
MKISTLNSFLLFFATLLSTSVLGQNTQPDALMLRFPDVSDNQITFVYAEDIWVVPKSGGLASRITSAKGMETNPQFSPDGSTIAFSGNYDGNTDIYTIPSKGGFAQRITHHPTGERMVSWYPDGKSVLIASRMQSPSGRFSQFYKQPIAGGLPEKLPLFYAELGSFNADGSKLAYQYLNRLGRTWKRYQGGMASDVWIHDFGTGKSEKITSYKGTDALPMWDGNKVYFLSDRETTKLNIWSYDTEIKQFAKVTDYKEFDVKFPNIGNGEIIFENGGKLFLLNLSDNSTTEVKIQVPSELMATRTESKNLSRQVFTYCVSPTGKRALFGARGEILTVPKEDGVTLNLTNTSGVAERDPKWSPDGKYIAYFSDKTGEYELYIQDSKGKEKAQQLTTEGSMFLMHPEWSPDSKKIAFTDKTGQIKIIDVASKAVENVFKDDYNVITDFKWSPDSRWLVFPRSVNTIKNKIAVYDSESKQVKDLTSGFYNDNSPVFSTDGKYLFYVSIRNFSPIYSDYDATWIYPNGSALVATTLQKSTPSILAPENDMEEVKEKKKEDDEGKGKKGKDKKGEEKEEDEEMKVAIDFDGFEYRSTVLPVDVKNVGSVFASEGKVLYLKFPAAGAGADGQPNGELCFFDLEEKEEGTIISGINNYDISADAKQVIYNASGSYGIIEVAKGKKVGDGKISLNGLKATIEPKEEWAQIYKEAWRHQRDFFYASNMHGVDWKAMGDRYEKLLPFATSRQDVNYIIGELIGELNVGHAYVGGGDAEYASFKGVGMLGADFALENGAYKITKIYKGSPWDIDVKSPLAQPGVDISEGDYVLAVNTIPVDAAKDIWASFQGLANETVMLTVNSEPNTSGAKDVLVKTISNESRLRNLAWIEHNRQKVADATGGKVGYIYVPNTGIQGQTELVRMFQGQYDKDALIIDERFNSGGQIPDRFIELLNRPVYNYWGRRDHKDWQTPFVNNNGPKVMIANEWAGSGGDAFPYYFKKAGVGPVVGKRTWGGLVGISGIPPLIDGGFLSSPNFGMWTAEDGKWAVEGYGVDPDYEVDAPADVMGRGDDPQLDKAIEVIKQELEKNPPKTPQKPPYPNKTGLGNN